MARAAPTEVGATQVERLLAELNPPQREAVTHGEGPLLVLAGAGSGKTRVLTHRIAWLLATDRARHGEILAITFTNKAAEEMRERVGSLIGGVSRGMWVTTFHSACARILRIESERLGYTSRFTIYDEADSLRMLKRCLQELEVDTKRYPPRAIRARISSAKNDLVDAETLEEEPGSPYDEIVASAFKLYEKRMLEANAMDFDDLLVRTVNLFELFEDVRIRYRDRFRWVLVDEYQDTNRAQYRLLQLLCEGENNNLFVVGDDDQCLVEGTKVTMGDGSKRSIEEIEAGDEVMACYGSGDFRPARVSAAHRSSAASGVAITTAGGKRIVSTSEHVHFAGYRLGTTPQMHMTYLMWKRGVGFRVGTSCVYTDAKRKPRVGVAQRSAQEGADAAWVISTHEDEKSARTEEAILAAYYGLPVLPFQHRKGPRQNGVVADQNLIDEVFRRVDTEDAGHKLLLDQGLDFDHPHHIPLGHPAKRRRVTVTLCGDRRGASQMHRLSLFGYDEEGSEILSGLGLSTRPARRNSRGWRHESAFKKPELLQERLRLLEGAMDVVVWRTARLGKPTEGQGNSLPFLPAGSVRPGMAMFSDDGSFEVVDRVENVVLDRPVYDLDVESVHNFIAQGLITHNSIYGFRHADIRNILEFERDFPDAEIVRLEQNYRSTQTILSAANGVISHNHGRKGKTLWTDDGGGDPVTIAELDDEHAEARYVAAEVERLVAEEGESREEIAVFYRVNAQSRVLEDILVRYEVPYQVIGGTKFYERAEVKDAVAYLNLIVNPADAVSFGRVVNSPRRGIGQTSQARLASHANTTGQTIWEIATRAEEVPGLGAAAIRSIGRFTDTIGELRELAERAPVAEVLEAVLEKTGYLETLRAERTIEAEGRIENLQELVGVAGEFDANRAVEGESELSPVEEFLQAISLYTDQDELRDGESLVTLMTLHNAKGLEYGNVFLIGCEEGLFPHSRSLEEGSEEEERRLCYVGMTRAKRRLYVTFARSRRLFGGRDLGLPSRFIDEIPEALTDRHSEAARTTGWSLGGEPVGRGGRMEREDVPQLTTGDDVLHPSFGEGVVTSVEPGGVVVVRFADDGGERKLMADYAPLKKR